MAKAAEADPDFLANTVVRSLPNLDRPRLSTHNEAQLAPLEQRMAACYAEIETVTEDLKRLHQVLENDGNAVPDEFLSEENSLVHSIDEIQTITVKAVGSK